MSTLTKKETIETSDPVFLVSGKVSKEVVKESVKEKIENEPTLRDVLNIMNARFDMMDTKLDALESRMAVQEARS